MKKLKVCVDAGHGWGNRHPGKYDPGACHVQDGPDVEEAAVTYDYAVDVAAELMKRGADAVLTRALPTTPIPVWKRDDFARSNKCDVLVSLHLNDADSTKANGIETWYEQPQSGHLASLMQPALVLQTGFKDRGVKQSSDLSDVLNFRPYSILIELGFINNEQNRDALLRPERRKAIAGVIASVLTHWWQEVQDGLPH